MQSTRGAAILAAVAVLTGGLAACADDSEPEESTTTASPIDPSKSSSTSSDSSSSSESSSESSTSSTSGEGKVAELPEEAKAQTKEGAIAFNEWYHVFRTDEHHPVEGPVPVLLLVGISDRMNYDLFNGNMSSLPLFIYDQYRNNPGAVGEYRAWGAALTLVILVGIASGLAALMSRLLAPKTK